MHPVKQYIPSSFSFQGSITDKNGNDVGLEYVQGGYPPLALSADKGVFRVMARSDAHVFIEKGGCGVKKKAPTYFQCPKHPYQQVSRLFRLRHVTVDCEVLATRVAESEVKYPTPTPTFPKFPTPAFPKFPTPGSST